MSAVAVAAPAEAHTPPLRRDAVRLLVVPLPAGPPEHHPVTELPGLLAPGDVLVINTSGTLPAALEAAGPGGEAVVVHVSGPDPEVEGRWIVEVRGGAAEPGQELRLPAGGRARLRGPHRGTRLWSADLALPAPLPGFLARHGRPIRYAHANAAPPLSAYQTVYATEPGSAEMPSAGRPLTTEAVTRLVARGIDVAPLVLHTGVSSLERGEAPYPERFSVAAGTAERVNLARRLGGRVVAVGTTVVRALEAAAEPDGTVRAARGWTDLVVDPGRGVRVVDGLLTGFHDPEASHLSLLEAVAGRPALERAYAVAAAAGYRRHEWGDLALFLPERRSG